MTQTNSLKERIEETQKFILLLDKPTDTGLNTIVAAALFLAKNQLATMKELDWQRNRIMTLIEMLKDKPGGTK